MFLSIVVPVYNVEKYLDECLQSLYNQDLSISDYEVICVNDGSNDNSLEILKTYTKYDNFRLINKENGGISSARNCGLISAKGDYIWFVDADDFITMNILKGLKKIIKLNNVDKVSFKAYFLGETLNENERKYYENNKLKSNHFTGNVYVTTSIFKNEFLNKHKLRFKENISTSEDSLFMLEFNLHSPKTLEIDGVYYLHRNNPGSICNTNNEETIIRKIDSSLFVAKYVKSIYDQNVKYNRAELADLIMSNYWQACDMIISLSKEKRSSYLKQLKYDNFFPLKRITDCTIKKSYRTSRNDIIGKLYDYIYININTRIGFNMMLLWNKLYKLLKKSKNKSLDGRNILIAADYRTKNSGNFVASLYELREYLLRYNCNIVFLLPQNGHNGYPWVEWLIQAGGVLT